MSTVPHKIKLNNGYEVPAFGLGTWQGSDNPGVVANAVKLAIDAGYRHFDCASVYGNEREIGESLKKKIDEGAVTREELYIVTKLWNDEHKQELVVPACKRSLKKLGLDYLDLYLVHWPFSYPDEVDFVETWRGMEECVRLGLTRSIGLSNFNSQQINRILEIATIKPVMNQIEAHVNLNQKKLREFCASKSIAITAYSPLGATGRCTPFQPSGPEISLNAPEITNIAKKYNKTNAQVALRYLIDNGMIPIPKSSSPERIRQNIDVFDFKLSSEEIATIDRLDTGYRTCTGEDFKQCTEWPFTIEF